MRLKGFSGDCLLQPSGQSRISYNSLFGAAVFLEYLQELILSYIRHLPINKY